MSFFCIHCRSEIDPAFKACPHCGEAVTDFLRRYLQHPIDGKYQILARLGVGGMGEVYKVLHIHLNAVRVIKMMRPQIAGEAGAHERFLREARLATKIQHPNVSTLFDFSTLDDGSRYMVWEFIEGTNLHELLEECGPLAPRYAAKLAVQALRGLDAIHRAGIVHRDVSPENLMITRTDEGERVKIIDLGIAKGSEASDDKTKTGMFVGKWKYCSPEHLGILEAGERIDGRADLYSFGIVLYEMLTGAPPFQADTPHSYLLMHASERPKRLREVNPTVPEAPQLEALIFRALEKDRAARFASAREFADAIERIEATLPDTPGAQQVEIASEVTDEATRVAAPKQAEIATVVSTSVAETILTPAPQPLPIAVPRRPRAPMIAAAAFVALAGGAFVVFNRHKEVARAVPAAPKPKPVAAASVIVPAARGRVAVNAFPWAQVSVKNAESGESVELGADLVTPAPLELAPGVYEITFRNPQFPTAITKKVEIKANEETALDVQFADPARAPMPDFGAAR